MRSANRLVFAFAALIISCCTLASGIWYFKPFRIPSILSANLYSTHTPICPNNDCANWPTPRIVTVKDTAISGTGDVSSATYTEAAINQTTVDSMMDRGILTLTGKSTVTDAWTQIFTDRNTKNGRSASLRDYQPGEIVAIKVNWNNSDAGYGSPSLINPVPQTIAAILKQLSVAKGIPQNNLYVYDCTENRRFYRYFTDHLKSKGFSQIHYVGAAFDDNTVIHENPTVGSVTNIAYQNVWCGQVESKFTYIINVPQLKAHGPEFGITLGFKNHFGSLINPNTLNHNSPSQNLLIPLNKSPIIANKTLITIGDGLYANRNNNIGGWYNRYNTLFFGSDPVALDSVMLDNLGTIPINANSYNVTQNFTEAHQIYLHIASYNGPGVSWYSSALGSTNLGVHEHWNNATNRQYSKIENILCSPNCPGVPAPTPTTPPSKPGDANGDSFVNGLDYVTWLSHFNQSVNGTVNGDFNNSGRVDGLDYVIWLNNFGK